jgi:hypothetical protein
MKTIKHLRKNYRDTGAWKDLPSLWFDRINIVKVARLSKVTYICNVTPIKISMTFFKEIGKKL